MSPKKKLGASKPNKKLSRKTISVYRKKGFDVGPKGKPDYEKAAEIHEAQQEIKRGISTGTNGSQYWDERCRKVKALQMERQFAISMGKLVDAEEVKKKAFETARTVRDHMLNIPNRVAGQLAAETNQDRVFEILNKEILQALEGLPQ